MCDWSCIVHKRDMPTVAEVVKICQKEIKLNSTNPTVLIKVPTKKYKEVALPKGNVIQFNHAFWMRPQIVMQNRSYTTLKFDAKLLLRGITHGVSQPFKLRK